MAKYVLLAKIRRPAIKEWWDSPTEGEESIRIFDTFEEAKSVMRKAITRIVKKSDFFPMEKDGTYSPLAEYAEYGDEDIERLGEIIRKTLTSPSYECKEAEDLDIQDTDDGDHYFAFVGNKDLLLADYYGTYLKMNVHNMSDPNGSYFFLFEDTDDDGTVTNVIALRLLSTAKKKKKDKKELPKTYETVTFGRYLQGADGEELTPLSWRVLEETDDALLLITEKVVDHIQFSALGNNKWATSDLRTWLNTEFADRAFNGEEKQAIREEMPDETVSLLSLEEYLRYFSDPKDARAEYTDYTRSKTHGGTVREPYAFWWLCTPNEKGGWGESGDVYVYHVCNNGTVNPYERGSYTDGVRPTIRVKKSGVIREGNDV